MTPLSVTVELVVVLLAYYLIEFVVLISDHAPESILLLLVETLNELPFWLPHRKLVAMARGQDIGAPKL